MLLRFNNKEVKASLDLPGSKSISNRLLILNEVTGRKTELKNLSDSKDTVLLLEALQKIKKNESAINIGDAGTGMRFLTAFLSVTEGDWLLTGSERMKERPIGELVNALRQIGAEITYKGNSGYPPLFIKGKKLNGGKVEIDGSTSSQFISALLLISPALSNGLEIEMKGKTVSWPYISMTLDLLNEFGIKVKTQQDTIKVIAGSSNFNVQNYIIEADWSSASYWFSLVALAPKAEVILHGLNEKTSQGDKLVTEIYKELGVGSEFKNGELHLSKIPVVQKKFEYDFIPCPDLAQTVAVTCYGLRIPCHLKGLSTLKIKETDRLLALQTELEKLGALVKISSDSLEMSFAQDQNNKSVKINSYGDHRMAMSFAPLTYPIGEIEINDPSVVVKSFPKFWEELKKAGIEVQEA